LYYSSVLIIALYLAFSLIYHKGYVEFEQPVGGVSMHIHAPKDQVKPLSELSYCQEGIKCVWWNESDILHSTSAKEILITTFVEEFYEELTCAESEKYGKQCYWNIIETPDKYYIAGVEDLEVIFNHRMEAPNFFEDSGEPREHPENRFSGSVKSMKGVLMNPKDTKPSVRKYLYTADYDRIKLKDLLGASNCSLHDKRGGGRPHRQAGIELLADISYNNLRCNGSLSCAFGTVPVSYRYRIFHLPPHDFELVKVESHDGTHRLRRIFHGVLIQTSQVGKIARFSWPVLVQNFVSGFWLLSIAVVIIDVLAIYVFKEKQLYFRKKYAEVADELLNASGAPSPKTKKE